MINSTAFDYVNVLTKAADASYQREAILANNISNVDTPGYKRKDLNFEGVLSQELGRCKHQSLDKKISELDTSKLTANVYTDHSNYSYRMDGNTHYLVCGISLSLNKKSDGYKTYGEDLSAKKNVILADITDIIGDYTMEQYNTDKSAVHDKILKTLQKKFGADYIVDVNIVSSLTQ